MALSAGGCSAGGRSAVAVRAPVVVATPCPSAVQGALPSHATRWLFARPAAILGDAGLAPAVARWLDPATTADLGAYALRTGVDPRLLDRVATAWSGESVVYVGIGPFDAPAAVDRLWDRLLLPRARHDLGPDGTAIEGVLAHRPVALVVRPACHLAAFGQGPGRGVTARVLGAARDEPDPPPDVLLRLWGTGIPSAPDAPGARALAEGITHWSLQVSRATAGADVTVQLDGTFPDDAAIRGNAVLDAFVTDPLGDLTGAADWLAPAQRHLVASSGRIDLRVNVPSAALVALASLLHGRVDTVETMAEPP